LLWAQCTFLEILYRADSRNYKSVEQNVSTISKNSEMRIVDFNWHKALKINYDCDSILINFKKFFVTSIFFQFKLLILEVKIMSYPSVFQRNLLW
jgi:hypothetical protein